MSGHSKWSTIKRKKAAEDAKRGKIFTKLAREIQIAAREGPDPDTNLKLRLVVDKAKAANMPKENIERAIRRGAGLEKGEELEEIYYEGYGPHGVAMMVLAVTDNRNRTVSDVRRIFNRGGGSLGETGCVSWLFEPKGYITVDMDNDTDPDELFMIAADAGADDVVFDDHTAEIYTEVSRLKEVREALEEAGIRPENAEISMVPKSTVSLGRKETEQNMALIESLEELDDVQQVYSNLEIPEELLEEVAAA
ncbi:MAG TPA: YebC/PmpR family DNA-binding transcriptional regulator [Anaerolineae bacterium]|nr:YebC/PmpR family DNA-binding transcriptional regulator [Anaerolineae bacterium]